MSDELREALDRLPRLRITGEQLDAIDPDPEKVVYTDWDEWDEYVRLDAVRAALAAHRVEPAPTLDERARVERDARLRDARDALDMAALWLHRTFDLPARDSQQAESWERKARSGRVALAAEAPERPA